MVNQNSEVSVIVITYNGKRHLRECFDSLMKQTYKDCDFYLLDNASSDGSSEFIERSFPAVKTIRFGKNEGFAEGYNRAIQQVNSKYIALLNDDTKVDPKWLEELVKAIKEDSKIFAVGSKIFFYDKPSLIQHAGGMLTLTGGGIDFGFGDNDKKSYNRAKFVGTVCGGAMMVRRDIFQNIGGFDKHYFAYFEDVDVCWRGWLRGYKTLFVPTSIVYHKFGGSWGKQHSYNRVFYGTKNRWLNLIKNFDRKNLILAFYMATIFDVLKLASFLWQKQEKNVFCLLNAYYQTFIHLPDCILTRLYIQSNRKLRDSDLFKLGLFLTLPESLHEFKRLKN